MADLTRIKGVVSSLKTGHAALILNRNFTSVLCLRFIYVRNAQTPLWVIRTLNFITPVLIESPFDMMSPP